MPVSTRDGAVVEVDLEHAVHARDADDDAVGRRQGAPAQRRTRAARHHLESVLWQYLRTRDTSSVVRGSTTASGMLPIGGERIGLEGAPTVLVGDHAFEADQRLKILDDGAAPVEHCPIGLRHPRQRHSGLRLGSLWRPRRVLDLSIAVHPLAGIVKGSYDSTAFRIARRYLIVAARRILPGRPLYCAIDRGLLPNGGTRDCHK